MMRLRRTDGAVIRALAAGALFASTLAGATLYAASASADLNDDKAKVEKALDAAHDDLDDTSSQLRRAYVALADTRSKVPAAQNALAAAEAAQAAAEAANQQAIADLAIAQADEARAAAQLSDTRSDLADTRSAVAGFAAQLYQEQGTGTLSVALDATDPQQLADRMAMADTVMDIQNGALTRLSTQSASLTATADHLTALRARSEAAQKRTEQAQAAASAATTVAATAKAELDTLVAKQSALTGDLEAERAREKRRIADLNAASAAITKKLAAIAQEEERKRKAAAAAANQDKGGSGPTHNPTNPPPANTGGFLSAPSSGWISSEFGMRYHPILHYWRLHSGRDYAAACGTPIYAAAPGTVVGSGWGGGYGNQVIISHGIQRGVGLATTYNHMSRIVAGYGPISRGALVGYVGTTGLSTGCHLHFEARENGVPVDPRKWL